jgi:hypothetical protein
MVFMSALLLTNWVRSAEVSKDATSAETQTQRDARLQWFRDAKFGIFVHHTVEYAHDVVTNHVRLFSGDKVPFAFHTDNGKNPWAKIDLGAVRIVRTVEIENRKGEQERTKGLVMSISEDGQKWEDIWQAKSWVTTWIARVTESSGGTVKSGRKARFIKLETRGESPGRWCSGA